jgi:hypothetical protein
MVLETLAFSSLNHLTRLVAREDFVIRFFLFPLSIVYNQDFMFIISLYFFITSSVFIITINSFLQVLLINPMLSGSTVTTAWRVLGLRIEETASRYGG